MKQFFLYLLLREDIKEEVFMQIKKQAKVKGLTCILVEFMLVIYCIVF